MSAVTSIRYIHPSDDAVRWWRSVSALAPAPPQPVSPSRCSGPARLPHRPPVCSPARRARAGHRARGPAPDGAAARWPGGNLPLAGRSSPGSGRPRRHPARAHALVLWASRRSRPNGRHGPDPLVGIRPRGCARRALPPHPGRPLPVGLGEAQRQILSGPGEVGPTWSRVLAFARQQSSRRHPRRATVPWSPRRDQRTACRKSQGERAN